MTKEYELVPDVQSFLAACSEVVGNCASENFSQSTFSEFFEKGDAGQMASPIEQILYCSLKTFSEIHEMGISHQQADGKPYLLGLDIVPQVKIGNYRVDFLVTLHGRYKSDSLVVECDSQEFHDRTEAERRYEKKRDRFLQSNGYQVFRFTGTEIKREPFRVAAEIISHLAKFTVAELLESIVNYKVSK